MKNLNPLRSFAIAFALCLALASCRKKDSINVTPAPQLIKIEQDANNYIALSYNADRTLSLIKDVEDSYISETEITYNTDKKPIAGKTTMFSLDFIYTGGKLTRINTLDCQTKQLIGFTEFTYQNNQLIQTGISATINGQIVVETRLSYLYYSNGDVKQIAMSELDFTDKTFSVYAIHRFEYDQKVNPLQFGLELFSGLNWHASAHNIAKETVLTANEQLQETITTTYTYDQATGMPLTAIEKSVPVDGDVVTVNKKFIYK